MPRLAKTYVQQVEDELAGCVGHANHVIDQANPVLDPQRRVQQLLVCLPHSRVLVRHLQRGRTENWVCSDQVLGAA